MIGESVTAWTVLCALCIAFILASMHKSTNQINSKREDLMSDLNAANRMIDMLEVEGQNNFMKRGMTELQLMRIANAAITYTAKVGHKDCTCNACMELKTVILDNQTDAMREARRIRNE